MMFRTITIAALVGFVSANTYSIGCMKTLMDLQQNAEVTTCLQPTLLVPILVGLGNGPESVIGYTDAWLAGMCGAPACTDDTLNTAISKVTTGCSAEFGIAEVQHALDFLKKGYRTLRKVVCLKDGEVNCVSGSLRNIEAITGTMSLDANNLVSIAGAAKKGFPSSVICTNCMKGAYSIINKELPGAFTDSDTKYATDTCGAQFADGGIPPGLVSSAWEPSNSEAPAPSSTSITPQSTPTIAPISVAPSPNRKNGALGGPSALSSGAFIAVSGFIALLAALV
ncbi:hypothetical protein D9615_004276 [Tricholomella constricta]|uniref:Uncharacterized protein n=1 Tax=Tricholomella constricta TaxID=117010 RepID=A0A8H5HEW3_9AGAR|nr:hypothetical protein D9615_004276 [Tricholomella constricta]